MNHPASRAGTVSLIGLFAVLVVATALHVPAAAFELNANLQLITTSSSGPGQLRTMAWLSQDRHSFLRRGPIQLPDATFIGCVDARRSRARAYVSGPEGIRSLVTTDGVVWRLERTVCMKGGWDPAVIRMSNDAYLMLYCAHARTAGESPEQLALGPDFYFPEVTWEPSADAGRSGPGEQERQEPDEYADAANQQEDRVEPEWTQEDLAVEDQVELAEAAGDRPQENLRPPGEGDVPALGEPDWSPEKEYQEGPAEVDAGLDEEEESRRIDAPAGEPSDSGTAPSGATQPPKVLSPGQSGDRAPDGRVDVDTEEESDRGTPQVVIRQGNTDQAESDEAAVELRTRGREEDSQEYVDNTQEPPIDLPPRYDWSEHDPADFVPKPDFQTDINYFEWYETQALPEVEDNAYEIYDEIIPGPFDEPDAKSELPEFHDMFNDAGYDGPPPQPWNPDDHPEWDESYSDTKPVLEKFHEAATHEGYAMPAIVGGSGSASEDAKDPLLINLLLPSLSTHRKLSKATLAAAWRVDEDGKVSAENLLDAVRTALRAARHFAGGTTLIEELVAMAERNLIRRNLRWALQQGVLQSAEDLQSALELLYK